MMVNDEAYQQHPVFGEIERYGEFYDDLGSSVFGFVSVGTRAICNIDSYVFSSIHGTLASIKNVLRDGRINDAYSLLRKYYDSAVINVYTGLYLEDHHSLNNFIVQQIDEWLRGKKQLPRYSIMAQYIRNSSKLAPITSLLFSDDRYKILRARCNDHTHYNFYRNVLLNDSEIHLPERKAALDVFFRDLQDVFILHAACMFFAFGHYMMSTDYVDCMDCGVPPPADSQYWVAPFVQDIFDNPIKKLRPDIAAVIKQHSAMQLA